jgi:Gametolysin peptidase M11
MRKLDAMTAYDNRLILRLFGALFLLALAAFPVRAHEGYDALSSSTALVVSGTVTELRVENRLTGQSLRYLGLRLDDGQSFALVGPPGLDALAKGERINATGIVVGQSIHVTRVAEVPATHAQVAKVARPSPTTLSGTLAIFHKDFFDQGRGELGLALVTSTGQIVQLTVAVIPDWFEPGMAITVQGTLATDGTSLDADMITVSSMGPATNAVLSAGPVTNKVLVIAVRFANSGANPFTPAQIDTVMQGQVAPYYQEVSFGQQLLNITVVPNWVQDAGNIPISASGPNAGFCDFDAIGSKADDLAAALGYDKANYQNRYYFFPNTSTCGGWAGLAYVGNGPNGRQAWSNGYNQLGVYGHELGHNFGLWHSGSVSCSGQALGGPCSVSEYGDPFDVMGNIRQMHFNSMQKSKLNWIPGTSIKQHLSGTQTYQLSPLETGGQTTYAVTIQASPSRKYWVEFRQPIGFDSPLSSLPNLGAQIRVGGPSFDYPCSNCGGDDTELLDMTPGTGGGFDDAALLAGQTYTDSTYGISVHVISATNSALTLSVSAPGGVAAPTVAGVVSRKTHGAAGTFNLPLSLVATNPTTEPRLGPAQTVVFDFGKPITGATAAVTEGTATAAAPTFSGNSVIVSLTGVSNRQYVTVALSNVTSADGGTGGTGSVRIGFLTGDVNQNRAVSLADEGLVNAALAQSVTALNYLKDVNASGTLTLADKAIVNANLTAALPAP